MVREQFLSLFLVEWENIDYNVGNYFDGKNFVVPENGLYAFHASCRQQSRNFGTVILRVNNKNVAFATRAETNSSFGFVNLQSTLKLAKNDEVCARFNGYIFEANESKTTCFEGRLIARLNE